MPEPSIHNILRQSFPKSSKEDWLRMAINELSDKNSIDNLKWKIDGLDFYPYYDKSDLKNLSYLKEYQNHSGGVWQNLPLISVSESKIANERALGYLAGGADGILFDISNCSDFNLIHLLEKINLTYCSVSFITSTDTKIATKIVAYAEEKNYDPLKLTGSIFWKKLPDNQTRQSSMLPALKNYHTLGIVVTASSTIKEISDALEQAVQFMDSMTDMGMAKEDVFRSINVFLHCGENFLVTIAKLKALRVLWYQLACAFQIPNCSPDDLHIHVFSEKLVTEKFNPHGNMIKNIPHALAAVFGGCNSLTLASEDENSDMMNRIVINVSNILKEESHIDKVTDPLAGVYAIENMVYELSRAAWTNFQNNLRT